MGGGKGDVMGGVLPQAKLGGSRGTLAEGMGGEGRVGLGLSHLFILLQNHIGFKTCFFCKLIDYKIVECKLPYYLMLPAIAMS